MFRKILFLFLTVTIMLCACGTMEVSLDQTPTPGVDGGQVATIVAATLAAVPSTTPALTPEVPSVLPRSLYYLAKDINGKNQIYRLGRDGSINTPVTSEIEDVREFDVSPVDGTLFYSLSDGGMIALDASGKDRRVLVEYLTFRPFWSPDGKTIAYAAEGNLYLYTFETGSIALLLAKNETDVFNVKGFSTDGKKLIVTSISRSPHAPTEGDVKIYDFESKKMTTISWWEHLPPCSDKNISWITGDSFFCSFSVHGIQAILPGLWRINANDGSVEALIASRRPPFQLIGAPRQDAMGNLYYLYGEHDGIFKQGNPLPKLSLVRSDIDGVTNQVVLRPETFQVQDAVWTPDGNAVLIFQNDEKGMPLNLILVPIDPSLPVVTLLAASNVSSRTLRWGP